MLLSPETLDNLSKIKVYSSDIINFSNKLEYKIRSSEKNKSTLSSPELTLKKDIDNSENSFFKRFIKIILFR